MTAEGYPSPEDEIGKEASKFLHTMRDLAIAAFILLRNKGHSQAIMEQARVQAKKIATAQIIEKEAQARVAKEAALRVQAWNKSIDPRTYTLKQELDKNRLALGIDKPVSFEKVPKPETTLGRSAVEQTVAPPKIISKEPTLQEVALDQAVESARLASLHSADRARDGRTQELNREQGFGRGD